MTAATLLAYVLPEGLSPMPSDETYASACWDQATLLVAQHIGNVTLTSTAGQPPMNLLADGGDDGTGPRIPWVVTDRAILEVAAEFYNRKDTKNGISQFASPDGGAGIRIARDPLVAAYPILAPYVGRGIA